MWSPDPLPFRFLSPGTGIRKPLTEGKKRHEFQADRGFRKFFKSTAERHMKSLHVEMLMGHDTSLAENYYRPAEATFWLITLGPFQT
jgi:hypothetical protein